MTITAALLLTLGASALVAGVGLVSLPAGVITAGVLLIAGGVLALERRTTPADGARS